MVRIEDIILAEQKRLEGVLRAAFAAGEEHAKSNMLALLSGEDTKYAKQSDPTDVNNDRKRAPRGLPRKLVNRVLSDNSFIGTSPQDIEDAAITDDEKMIALSTIRGELRKGKEAGRYTEEDGLWYLDLSASIEAGDHDDDDFSDIV